MTKCKYLGMIIVSIAALYGCDRPDNHNVKQEGEVNASQIHAFSDDKCQALGDEILDIKHRVLASNQQDAIQIEFKVATSSDGGQGQIFNCFFGKNK